MGSFEEYDVLGVGKQNYTDCKDESTSEGMGVCAAYVTRTLGGFKELSGDMHCDVHKITGWKTEVSAP